MEKYLSEVDSVSNCVFKERYYIELRNIADRDLAKFKETHELQIAKETLRGFLETMKA